MALNLLERIAERNPELTKSERKVASAVLADPNRTMTENIAKLARRAGVSEPTVFRFCKTFGANGFPDFKLALSGAVSMKKILSAEQVLSGDSVEDLISKVASSSLSCLNRLETELDPKSAAWAVDALSKARRIAVFSLGYSSGIALNFCLGLLDLGIAAENVNDPLRMNLTACTLGKGDVAVCLLTDEGSEQIISAASFAKESKAALITISPYSSKLRQMADCDLAFKSRAASDQEPLNPLSSQLALLAVIGILVKGVSLRRAKLTEALKPRLDRARGAIKGRIIDNDDIKGDVSSLRSDVPITTLDWDFDPPSS